MKSTHLLLTALMVAQTLAQSSDLLSIIASEAYSVFTSFTADQPTGTTTVSTASTATSSSASSASAASSTASPASSASTSRSTSPGISSTTASSSALGTSQTGSAAAASATEAAVSNPSNSHNRTLAIVLGTVLGALALGLLILVLLLLLRRRNHRRGTVRDGYVSPSSDSTIEAPKTATSRVRPVEGRDTPTRPESLHSRYYASVPLMSERKNHDVPLPHEFHDSNSVPFIPRTDNRTRSPHGSAAGHTGTWFTPADGLSSHPVHRHDLDGSKVAVGIGGAVTGAGVVAAAPRRSRHRRTHEEAMPSANTGRHPQYLDGPYPSRSPRRASMESAKRRSGSMPRGPLDSSQDQTSDPSISTTSIPRHQERLQLQSPLSSHELEHTTSKPNHGLHEMSAMPTPPIAKSNINPLDGDPTAHERTKIGQMGGTQTENGLNSSSRPRAYPPLPPALTIPQANRVQPPRIPSRSPKRARFADRDTYHEPKTYGDTHSLKSSNIASPIQTSPWTPRGQTMSASTTRSNELVSPISPEDTTRGFDHGVSIAPARANPIHIPPSRDPSPNPGPQTSTRQSDPSLNTTSQRHSGLVDAVQTHFTPSQPPTQRPSHLYTLFPIGPDHAQPDSRTPRALARKPVPGSVYSATAKPDANVPNKPGNENWWRGSGVHGVHLSDRQHEDSAWASNYGNERGS